MPDERLQKVLARAGIASRRAAEVLIQEGRVKVDGRVVRELGVRVDPRRARVDVDGRRIVAEPLVYVVLHKPRGVMCTLSDPEGRPTVAELLRGVGVRLVPVGRLDYHTSGVLLCTNDGEFAGRLLHPRGGVPKEYVAKVRGILDEGSMEGWRQSIDIEGRATQPAEVRLLRVEGDKTWISILLKEGRNRQVRRLGEATGNAVLRLARVAHAGIDAEGLRPGQWRYLTRDELIELKKAYGVPRAVRSAAHPSEEGARAPSRARPTTKRGRPGSKLGRADSRPARAPSKAARSPSGPARSSPTKPTRTTASRSGASRPKPR